MNREQRKPFLGLVAEGNVDYSPDGQGAPWTLCDLCRHQGWDGDGEWSVWRTCEHPIDSVADGCWHRVRYEGGDCWGFRPKGGLPELRRFLETGLMDWQRAWAEEEAAKQGASA